MPPDLFPSIELARSDLPWAFTPVAPTPRETAALARAIVVGARGGSPLGTIDGAKVPVVEVSSGEFPMPDGLPSGCTSRWTPTPRPTKTRQFAGSRGSSRRGRCRRTRATSRAWCRPSRRGASRGSARTCRTRARPIRPGRWGRARLSSRLRLLALHHDRQRRSGDARPEAARPRSGGDERAPETRREPGLGRRRGQARALRGRPSPPGGSRHMVGPRGQRVGEEASSIPGTQAVQPSSRRRPPSTAASLRAALPASGWLEDLNLDPRRRSSAGLGAEMVRAHQEAGGRGLAAGGGHRARPARAGGRAAGRSRRRAAARANDRAAGGRARPRDHGSGAPRMRDPGSVTFAARVASSVLPAPALGAAFRRISRRRRRRPRNAGQGIRSSLTLQNAAVVSPGRSPRRPPVS